MSTTKGVKHLSGELQSSSDLDFYVDGVSTGERKRFAKLLLSDFCQDMIHIADTKVARRYGDFFIRQINKLEEVR